MSDRARRIAIVCLLAASGVALVSAPLLLPPEYSRLRHSISESAAQGLEGAWVGRTGFLLFGLAVLWLASMARSRWGLWSSIAFGTFGVMMFGTAAYSHRPWMPDVRFDPIEDLLHSATATIMGAAFAAGVILVGLGRSPASRLDRAFDAVAVLAPVAIPLAMTQATSLHRTAPALDVHHCLLLVRS